MVAATTVTATAMATSHRRKKKSRSKKSFHSQKNVSKNKGVFGTAPPLAAVIRTTPASLRINRCHLMTVINYSGSSDGPLPRACQSARSKANPEPSPPSGPNRDGEKAENSKTG
ncbi:hypothetical protein TYRP_023259 [Tyrophagus putrescentiae]|nr:hypothetical protein TYRP_023259 [Tyrophagus putrescentiae]